MAFRNLPSISVLIPTLNAARVLEGCLKSIVNQDYPKEKVEIIIADGGSTDKTLVIAKKYGAKIYKNPLKTGEAGKAVALRRAQGELVALIDSDNLLPDKKWFQKMVGPLVANPNLIGSEPLYYSYRKNDGLIDRYCALLGMNDPLCLWIGNYDRMSTLTGKWTELPVKTNKKKGYRELVLESGKIPTIGANGAIFRRSIFTENSQLIGDYLFDIDVLEELISLKGPQKFAKVKVGIVHLYCGSDLGRFARKQFRRLKDMLKRRSVMDIFVISQYRQRKYQWGGGSRVSLIFSVFKFVLSCLLIFPLFFQSIKGYWRKSDLAWLAHPLLCWITLIVYTRATFESLFFRGELSRERWGQ
jgi:glycosyltransferase involved in cell wall biosynthesis